MGNEASASRPPYDVAFSDGRFNVLRRALQRNNYNFLDFYTFTRILTSRFERMPNVLCECLYLGFVSDVKLKIEISNFISTLSVICGKNRQMIVKFLFRVYDIKGMLVLDRGSLEGVLRAAYGVRSSSGGAGVDGPKTVEAARLLDELFEIPIQRVAAEKEADGEKHTHRRGRYQRGFTLRDFDSYKGSLDLLGGWVQTVLSVFLEELPRSMLALEHKYSANVEPEEAMARLNIPPTTSERLKQIFRARCGNEKNAELGLASWVGWCGNYLSSDLCAAIFRNRTRGFKAVWRFADFAEFCMTVGAGDLEDKALYVNYTMFMLYV